MIHPDTISALYAEATHLRVKLSEAQEDMGRLLCICKQAYNAQLSERSSLSVSLLEEIHRHEPDWQPEPRARREPWPTKEKSA